jgi:hypothetical protein
MTKPYLIAGLLLVATSAYAADHVWRIWCGNPRTPRGAIDTSDECWKSVTKIGDNNEKCVDTPRGPRIGDVRVPAFEEEGLRTCAQVRRYYANCTCEPEAGPEK